jgi:hypothetical protein
VIDAPAPAPLPPKPPRKPRVAKPKAEPKPLAPQLPLSEDSSPSWTLPSPSPASDSDPVEGHSSGETTSVESLDEDDTK